MPYCRRVYCASSLVSRAQGPRQPVPDAAPVNVVLMTRGISSRCISSRAASPSRMPRSSSATVWLLVSASFYSPSVSPSLILRRQRPPRLSLPACSIEPPQPVPPCPSPHLTCAGGAGRAAGAVGLQQRVAVGVVRRRCRARCCTGPLIGDLGWGHRREPRRHGGDRVASCRVRAACVGVWITCRHRAHARDKARGAHAGRPPGAHAGTAHRRLRLPRSPCLCDSDEVGKGRGRAGRGAPAVLSF